MELLHKILGWVTTGINPISIYSARTQISAEFKDDNEGIRSDWNAVGGDLYSSMHKFNQINNLR
jgi:hypothetical protein